MTTCRISGSASSRSALSSGGWRRRTSACPRMAILATAEGPARAFRPFVPLWNPCSGAFGTAICATNADRRCTGGFCSFTSAGARNARRMCEPSAVNGHGHVAVEPGRFSPLDWREPRLAPAVSRRLEASTWLTASIAMPAIQHTTLTAAALSRPRPVGMVTEAISSNRNTRSSRRALRDYPAKI